MKSLMLLVTVIFAMVNLTACDIDERVKQAETIRKLELDLRMCKLELISAGKKESLLIDYRFQLSRAKSDILFAMKNMACAEDILQANKEQFFDTTILFWQYNKNGKKFTISSLLDEPAAEPHKFFFGKAALTELQKFCGDRGKE